jgi:tubulin polyglutamylase TTLL6/13
MHLTNYALNKYNSNFNFNTSAIETNKGHKWSLSSLFKALQDQGFDTTKLFNQISQIVVMTMISIVPLLTHNYRTYVNEDDQGRSCFELLGMDVLIDNKCIPWLLEVPCMFYIIISFTKLSSLSILKIQHTRKYFIKWN